jgi:hypothetical protein
MADIQTGRGDALVRMPLLLGKITQRNGKGKTFQPKSNDMTHDFDL